MPASVRSNFGSNSVQVNNLVQAAENLLLHFGPIIDDPYLDKKEVELFHSLEQALGPFRKRKRIAA